MNSNNTICLWYDGTALEAATFCAKTFPDSAVGAVLYAPGDYPAGNQPPAPTRYTRPLRNALAPSATSTTIASQIAP